MVPSTDDAALGRPAVTLDCNGCNEALDASRATVRNARRLAFGAENALANGDITRASAALSDLNKTLTGFDDNGEQTRSPSNAVDRRIGRE